MPLPNKQTLCSATPLAAPLLPLPPVLVPLVPLDNQLLAQPTPPSLAEEYLEAARLGLNNNHNHRPALLGPLVNHNNHNPNNRSRRALGVCLAVGVLSVLLSRSPSAHLVSFTLFCVVSADRTSRIHRYWHRCIQWRHWCIRHAAPTAATRYRGGWRIVRPAASSTPTVDRCIRLVRLAYLVAILLDLTTLCHQVQTMPQSHRYSDSLHNQRVHLVPLVSSSHRLNHKEHRREASSALAPLGDCSANSSHNSSSSRVQHNRRAVVSVFTDMWSSSNHRHCTVFGTQPAQQQQQQPGTGLFGTGNTGSLFGNNANQSAGQQQQQQPGQTGGFGLFGAKPAAPATNNASGGLFGTGAFGQASNAGTAAPTQQGNLFGSLGQTGNTQPASTGFSGGLFGKSSLSTGTQQTQQQGGLFGTTPGPSLFGNTMGGNGALGQSTAQPQLTASIAQPISTNLPIFSMLPPGPRAVNLEQPKRKSSLFVDVPTRSPVPRLGFGYAPASSKLRGFTSTTMIPGTDGRPLGPAVSLTVGKPGALSLGRSAANKSLLGPDSFLGSVSGPSPGLGSGSRPSVKKLVLDKRIQPSDLFSKSSAQKVTFNPALSIAARESEAAAASSAAPAAPETPPAKTAKTSNRFSASSEQGKEVAEKEPELQEGDYYVRPSLAELKKRSFKELAQTEGLVVGRVGYGEIEFLDKVDITGLTRTSALMGDFVRFDDKECAVYPDCDEADKPPPGSGLNVRARITLFHCWPVDKATREPIQDEKHPAMVKHLKRLKAMKNTHFDAYDIENGKWVFTVDHF